MTAKKPEIHKGINIYADESEISNVMPDEKALIYRGYLVSDLIEAGCSFEEVAYLIWNGELPDEEQLKAFKDKERSLRVLDKDLLSYLKKKALKGAHPMDVLRTAISDIGTDDLGSITATPEENLEKAMGLMAKTSTILAAYVRLKGGKQPISPIDNLTDDNLSFSENFLYMCFGKIPEPEIVKAFDSIMIIYAEHSFNASTFAARHIMSSLTDIYSAVTGAIGSLKGTLHGGANEAVMYMIDEIGSPDNVEAWIRAVLEKNKGLSRPEKQMIMGIGHKIYKIGDSRVPIVKKLFNEVAKLRDDQGMGKICDTIEEIMLKEKGLYPNVDFKVGPIYRMMGLVDEKMYTAFFEMARIVGQTAHVIEMQKNNALQRPKAYYTGKDHRGKPIPSLEERGKKTGGSGSPVPAPD